MKQTISKEFRRHLFILEKNVFTEKEKELFCKLSDEEADFDEYSGSLEFLSSCLYRATGNIVVILLNEYDVPLENAYFNGFYDEMTSFIRSLFESALKTNDSLHFAVITGCLRISKESIFTGLNHLNMISVLDRRYSEHFGFTNDNVIQMMTDYGCQNRFQDMKEWYDGYTFGDTDVYNPWSVIKFMYDLSADIHAYSRPYWTNTSSNSIIKEMIYRADRKAKDDIENLLNGQTMDIQVHEEITYEDIYDNGDNLWNFLYFTGYLTKESEYISSTRNHPAYHTDSAWEYDRTLCCHFPEFSCEYFIFERKNKSKCNDVRCMCMVNDSVRTIGCQLFHFMIHQMARQFTGRSSSVYQAPADSVIFPISLHFFIPATISENNLRTSHNFFPSRMVIPFSPFFFPSC